MKCLIHGVAVSVLVVSVGACSKKEANSPQPTPELAAPAPQAGPDTAPRPAVAANVAQLENNINTALKQQNYDAAVDAIVQAQTAVANMSDDQRRQYAQQCRNASTALQAASVTDPKAKAAYDRMSRAVLGR